MSFIKTAILQGRVPGILLFCYTFFILQGEIIGHYHLDLNCLEIFRGDEYWQLSLRVAGVQHPLK